MGLLGGDGTGPLAQHVTVSRPAIVIAAMTLLASCGGPSKTTAPSPTPSSTYAPEAPECPREEPLAPGADAQKKAVDAVKLSLQTGQDVDQRTFEITSSYPATGKGAFAGVAYNLCGPSVGEKTWVVEIRFPKLEPSASLSQGQAFVARFPSGWRVWYRYH